MKIHKCKPSDEQAARELIEHVLREEFPGDAGAFPLDDIKNIGESYGHLGEAFFVAEDEGRIIGTVGVKHEDDRTALLRRLFVAPDRRREKIGARLIERIVKFCEEVGYSDIMFKTTSNMTSAINLCKKKGFDQKAHINVGPLELVKFKLPIKKANSQVASAARD